MTHGSTTSSRFSSHVASVPRPERSRHIRTPQRPQADMYGESGRHGVGPPTVMPPASASPRWRACIGCIPDVAPVGQCDAAGHADEQHAGSRVQRRNRVKVPKQVGLAGGPARGYKRVMVRMSDQLRLRRVRTMASVTSATDASDHEPGHDHHVRTGTARLVAVFVIVTSVESRSTATT